MTELIVLLSISFLRSICDLFEVSCSTNQIKQCSFLAFPVAMDRLIQHLPRVVFDAVIFFSLLLVILTLTPHHLW